MGLGQYDGLGEYCGPHTASSVFLILLPNSIHISAIIMQYFHIQAGGKYCNTSFSSLPVGSSVAIRPATV